MQLADAALRSWVLLAVTAPHLVSSCHDVIKDSTQQATYIYGQKLEA